MSEISGSLTGYSVQARVVSFNHTNPIKYADPSYRTQPLYLTEKWQTIYFFDGNNPAGVPVCNTKISEPIFRMTHLLSREAAVALAYTFTAQNDHYGNDIMIRIVPHNVNYTIKFDTDGEPINLSEHLNDFGIKMQEAGLKNNPPTQTYKE